MAEQPAAPMRASRSEHDLELSFRSLGLGRLVEEEAPPNAPGHDARVRAAQEQLAAARAAALTAERQLQALQQQRGPPVAGGGGGGGGGGQARAGPYPSSESPSLGSTATAALALDAAPSPGASSAPPSNSSGSSLFAPVASSSHASTRAAPTSSAGLGHALLADDGVWGGGASGGVHASAAALGLGGPSELPPADFYGDGVSGFSRHTSTDLGVPQHPPPSYYHHAPLAPPSYAPQQQPQQHHFAPHSIPGPPTTSSSWMGGPHTAAAGGGFYEQQQQRQEAPYVHWPAYSSGHHHPQQHPRQQPQQQPQQQQRSRFHLLPLPRHQHQRHPFEGQQQLAVHPEDATKNMRSMRCRACGQFGHLMRYCPMVLCFTCRQPGHMASVCPQGAFTR